MTSLDAAYQKIDRQLGRWDGRLRLQEALIWVPRGLLFGLLIGVALAAIARFRPLLTGQEILWVTAIVSVIGMAAAGLWVAFRPRTIDDKARFADRQFGLQERLITAIQLRDSQIDAPPKIKDQQVQDAAATIDHVGNILINPVQEG